MEYKEILSDIREDFINDTGGALAKIEELELLIKIQRERYSRVMTAISNNDRDADQIIASYVLEYLDDESNSESKVVAQVSSKGADSAYGGMLKAGYRGRRSFY